MKDLNLLEESLYLGLHLDVRLIGGCELGYVLSGGGCAFGLINLEASHHLICNCIGVVEDHFVNCSVGFPEFRVSFSEVVIEVIPCFVRRMGEFPRPDVVFEDLLSVEDNEGKVYSLTLR